ncbi:uncharacterized protein BDW70DRAFT_145655 [Aspergillus foveolatus]|uniref:uncharacterized protein n=1 Tax=Aspergillus foveolatus TaxID=210207 RepID=UPI003CCD10C3
MYLGHSTDAAPTVNGVTMGIAAPYETSTGRVCLVMDLVYPRELQTSWLSILIQWKVRLNILSTLISMKEMRTIRLSYKVRTSFRNFSVRTPTLPRGTGCVLHPSIACTSRWCLG